MTNTHATRCDTFLLPSGPVHAPKRRPTPNLFSRAIPTWQLPISRCIVIAAMSDSSVILSVEAEIGE
jgi:hypothetical protein